MPGPAQRRLVSLASIALFALLAGTASAGTVTLSYTTPGEHSFVVPGWVSSVHVVAVGAHGGPGSQGGSGGFGARVEGDVFDPAGETLYLEVGGQGGYGDAGTGGGGGASDVRLVARSFGLTPSDARLLVAGGGGGGGHGYWLTPGQPGSTGGDGGNAGAKGEDSVHPCDVCGMSGGGGAGVPAGTGLGGSNGASAANQWQGDAGAAGTLGVGGNGALQSSQSAAGGFNGGGAGGGHWGFDYSLHIYRYIHGGGGGGGGFSGGGGGGGVADGALNGARAGGGGGGGSNLVPFGGTASAGTAPNDGSITLSFTDVVAPTVTLAAKSPYSPSATPSFSGTSGTGRGDGGVIVDVYQGGLAFGVPVRSLAAVRDAATGTYTATTQPALPDGQYTAHARQSDWGGNVGNSASTTTFRVDTTPPTVSITSPAAGGRTNATPVIEGVAGVAAGDFEVVDVALLTADGMMPLGSPDRDPATGAFTFPISQALTEGPHSVSVTQLDADHSTIVGRSFIVDATAPAPTLATEGGEVPRFTGVAGTAVGDAAKVTVEVFSGSSVAGTPELTFDTTRDAGTGAYDVTSPVNLTAGTYTARAVQADDVGNVGRGAPATFSFGGSGPDPVVTDPGAGPVVDDPGPTDPVVKDPVTDAVPVKDPGSSTPAAVIDRTAPALSKVGLSKARWRGGAKPSLRFTLTEPGAVTITVAREKPRRKLGVLTTTGKAGANAFRFSGRVKGRRLGAGRYVLTVVATDAAGNRSAPKVVKLRIG